MTEDTCYPPDDPRHISPEELRNASIEVKIAYRRVVESKRENDIKEENVRQAKKNPWVVGAFTLLAALVAAGTGYYIKVDKDQDITEVKELIVKSNENDCNAALAKQRLSYDGNMCMKLVMAQRKTWATCKINNEILKNQK